MIQRVAVLVVLLALVLGPGSSAVAAPEGQIAWAVHTAIAPLWFDPGEATGQITQMIFWYAIHDALVKPMPGKPLAPSLAESWTLSKDGLVYEFVKFSFERYRGAAAKLLKDKVAAVEIVDPFRIRYRLREPWPDFMTFFATPATGAAWIVPRKHVEKVGADGYKVVSFNPGVEMVLEAHESTRLAMLKRGEVDIAYSIRGPLAEELRRTPGLKLSPTLIPATFWIDFTSEQWDPKFPWHDRRVWLAASLAIDRQAINQAETLGHSRIASSIVPSGYEFYWPAPPTPYDPAQAKRLLTEAGDYTCDVAYANLGEAVVNYLGAVGVRARLRPLERAAWTTQWREKKVKNLLQGAGGGLGNAVTQEAVTA